MVSDDELKQIMPRLSAAKRKQYLPLLQKAMDEFEITSYLREAAFLAQLAHESCELRYFEELADGSRYEGRKDLGNTQPGDGKRFKGRGPIQLTGRANYTKYGKLLGVDLVGNPKLAASPEIGFRIAGLYWKMRGLSELADKENFRRITWKVNGGYNGWESRLRYYHRALAVLSKEDQAQGGKLTPAIRVFVNHREVPDAQPVLQQDGRLLVALRPVADALGWRVIEAAKGRCLVQDSRQERYSLAMVMRGRTGYVLARELPCTLRWEDETRFCFIDSDR